MCEKATRRSQKLSSLWKMAEKYQLYPVPLKCIKCKNFNMNTYASKNITFSWKWSPSFSKGDYSIGRDFAFLVYKFHYCHRDSNILSWRFDHELLYMVILSLLLILEGQLSVSGQYRGLSLPSKSVVRWTDHARHGPTGFTRPWNLNTNRQYEFHSQRESVLFNVYTIKIKFFIEWVVFSALFFNPSYIQISQILFYYIILS